MKTTVGADTPQPEPGLVATPAAAAVSIRALAGVVAAGTARDWKRVGALAVSVAVAATLMLACSMLLEGIGRQLAEIEDRGRTVVVLGPGGHSITDSELQQAAATDGVQSVRGQSWFPVTYNNTVVGAGSLGAALSWGEPPQGTDQVVVGPQLGGVPAGAQLQVGTPSGTRTVTVTGGFSGGGAQIAWQWQAAGRVGGPYQSAALTLEDAKRSSAAQALRAQGWVVIDRGEPPWAEQLRAAGVALGALGAGVAIAALGVCADGFTVVSSRRVGRRKALEVSGASPTQIYAIAVGEAAAVGAVGATAGVAGGVWLGQTVGALSTAAGTGIGVSTVGPGRLAVWWAGAVILSGLAGATGQLRAGVRRDGTPGRWRQTLAVAAGVAGVAGWLLLGGVGGVGAAALGAGVAWWAASASLAGAAGCKLRKSHNLIWRLAGAELVGQARRWGAVITIVGLGAGAAVYVTGVVGGLRESLSSLGGVLGDTAAHADTLAAAVGAVAAVGVAAGVAASVRVAVDASRTMLAVLGALGATRRQTGGLVAAAVAACATAGIVAGTTAGVAFGVRTGEALHQSGLNAWSLDPGRAGTVVAGIVVGVVAGTGGGARRAARSLRHLRDAGMFD